ncbi:unnamed protein product [Alternaria alternata]|jgi:hypothetical protein
MRLIQFFDNGDYCLTSRPSEISPEPLDDKPFYGILSHRWGPAGDEITYQELMDGKRRSIRESDLARVGFRKLQFCQQRAAKEGLRYFWIDTCCINKQDQSELSYALNSMFHWYKQALRCYVYMSDVACTTGGEAIQNMTFENSQWFKRGWTLQELIAPTSVVFYSREGTYIGSKRSLEKEIHQITKIPVKALRDSSSLSTFSAEERFRWTHGRKTTRPEDTAYCLLGIYDVWMTPIYADGDWETLKSRAIEGLKSEIKDKRGKEEVVVIGGASWSDLSAISDHRLPELDQDIREYTAWLLQQGYSPTTSHLTQTSTNAGRKMREMLGKYDVDYNDDSGLHGRITTWQEPWSRFLHQKSSFERVRGFLDNRWWIGNGSEYCHTGIMAAKTLMGLILWRDIKDLR